MPRPSLQFPRLCLLIFFLALPARAEPRATDTDTNAGWQIALDAASEGRFEDASGALEKILHSAIAAGNASDAARAILLKIEADSSREKQDGNPLHPIQSLTTLLEKTQAQPQPPHPSQPQAALPAATIPILHYALANQYRRLIPPRPSPSIHRRYFAEAARHYQLALANPAILQATPIETLEPLITSGERKPAATGTGSTGNTGSAPPFADKDKCRPTLYDFFAFEAIDFFAVALGHGFLDAENLPALPGDSQLLAPLESFLSWKPASTANWVVVATLHQDLLRFHQNDPAPRLALAEADLRRIMWAASLFPDSETPPKAARLHEAALRDFIDQWRNTPDMPAVAAACAELAALLYDSSPDAAHTAATEGARLQPGSPGAARCRNLIAQLEAPDLIATATEHTWNAPWPDITIIHRNIAQIHFRAVPCEWEEFFKNKHGPLNRIPKEDLDALLKLKPAKAWSVTLPASRSLKIREEKLSAASIARTLKPGFYFVIASAGRDFSGGDSGIFCAPVWVSDLAIVYTPTDGGQFTGCVVDALTGNPVPGASVTAWLDTTNTVNGRAVASADGAFSVFPIIMPEVRSDAYNCHLVARAPDGRAIASSSALKPYPSTPFHSTPNQAFFYTDRSVYHPGETIHYKILAVSRPDDAARPSPLADYEIPIQIGAPGVKWTGSHIVRTNAFGSASGSFTLPATDSTGVYYLSSEFRKVSGGTMLTVMPRAAAAPVASSEKPVEAISLSADGLLTTTAPVTLVIKTSINGAPVSARGTLSIYPLKNPKKTPRAPLLRFQEPFTAQNETPDDLPLGKPRVQQNFATGDETGIACATTGLPAGVYRAVASARAASGETITASTVIRVFNPNAKRSPAHEHIAVEARSWEVRPGDTFKAIWASGDKNARACIAFEQDGNVIRRLWTQPGVTQQAFEFPIDETMRGGVRLRVFQVSDNRFTARHCDIRVPYENQLAVEWDRSNTPPRAGSRATWTVRIQNTDTTTADAEVAAVLHDDALDPLFRHEWPGLGGFFRNNQPGYDSRPATNTVGLFHQAINAPPPELEPVALETHPRWDAAAANLPGRHPSAIARAQEPEVAMMEKYTVTDARPAARKKTPGRDPLRVLLQLEKNDLHGAARILSLVQPPALTRPRPNRTVMDGSATTSALQANPTTFFFPALHPGKDGRLRITFDAPEDMTRSKLMLFAHDRRLNFALLVRNFAAGTDKNTP